MVFMCVVYIYIDTYRCNYICVCISSICKSHVSADLKNLRLSSSWGCAAAEDPSLASDSRATPWERDLEMRQTNWFSHQALLHWVDGKFYVGNHGIFSLFWVVPAVFPTNQHLDCRKSARKPSVKHTWTYRGIWCQDKAPCGFKRDGFLMLFHSLLKAFQPGWLGYPLRAKTMVPKHQHRAQASPQPTFFGDDFPPEGPSIQKPLAFTAKLLLFVVLISCLESSGFFFMSVCFLKKSKGLTYYSHLLQLSHRGPPAVGFGPKRQPGGGSDQADGQATLHTPGDALEEWLESGATVPVKLRQIPRK